MASGITHRDLANLKLTARPLPRPGWICEFKLDGFRVLAGYEQGRPQLISRRGTNLLPCFPEIGRELERLKKFAPIALDGELVIVDEDGKPQFERLRRRLLIKRQINVRHASRHDPAALFAFDVLVVRGHDVRDEMLLDRKIRLAMLLDGKTNRIVIAKHTFDGEELFRMAEAMQIEGIVAKPAASLYRSGYASGWLKVKTAHGRATDAERRRWNG